MDHLHRCLIRLVLVLLVSITGGQVLAQCVQYKVSTLAYGQSYDYTVAGALASYCSARGYTGCFWGNTAASNCASTGSAPGVGGFAQTCGYTGGTLFNLSQHQLVSQSAACPTGACPVFGSGSTTYAFLANGSGAAYFCDLDIASGVSASPGCLFKVAESVCVTIPGQPKECAGTGKSQQVSCAPSAGAGTSASVPSNVTSSLTVTASVTTTAACDGYIGTVGTTTVCIPRSGGGMSVGTSQSSQTTVTGSSTSTGTQTASTLCDGVACTTSTTTSTSTGGTVSTSVTTIIQSQGLYCATRAYTVECGGNGIQPGTPAGTGGDEDSGSVGGSCGSQTCDGDAIQCAVANAVRDVKCAFSGGTTETVAYEEAVAGTGARLTTSTVSMGSSTFNSTEFLGAASGLTDLSVDALGRTWVVPFSMFNPYLQMMGAGLMAMAFLLAIGIVVRGKK